MPTTRAAPHYNSLVGRSQSLRQLEDVLQTIDVAGGGMVAIVGAPGVGKTRLVEMFARKASSGGATTVWGRFTSEQAPSPRPLAHILEELLSTEHINEVRSLTPLTAWPELDKIEQSPRELAVDSGSSDLHLLDQIENRLCELSRSQRLVIFLEDLQRADAASLRLLTHIANNLKRWRVMIVTTLRLPQTRLDDTRHHELLRLLCHRRCQRIQLNPFNERDVQAYVDEIFGPGPSDLVSAVYTSSAGNPFQMVELLRPWTVGLVERPAPEQLTLPPIVHEEVHAKLSLLTDCVKLVLRAASVLGREFDLGLLSHLTRHRAMDLLDVMDAAMASEILVPSTDALSSYAFSREVIREVLYSSIPIEVRHRMHLKAAQVLRQREFAGRSMNNAELARHLLAALPDGDPREALEHASAAAETCLNHPLI